MTNRSVVLVQFVELSLFEENDRIPKVLFDFPVLLLECREVRPCKWWNIDRPWVVVGMTRWVLVCIFEVC